MHKQACTQTFKRVHGSVIYQHTWALKCDIKFTYLVKQGNINMGINLHLHKYASLLKYLKSPWGAGQRNF